MARNNRGGSNRGSRNNNPSGRNQYSSDWGVMDMARERPVAAAAVAAGAAAAGLFLWTKRARSAISSAISPTNQRVDAGNGLEVAKASTTRPGSRRPVRRAAARAA